jgi:hypothetical protein
LRRYDTTDDDIMMFNNIIKRYSYVKILALYLVRILLTVMTKTGSADSIITNVGLFQNSEAQLADNSNSDVDLSL